MSIRVRLGKGFTYGRSGLRYNTRNVGIGRSGTRLSAGPITYWAPGKRRRAASAPSNFYQSAAAKRTTKWESFISVLTVVIISLAQLFIFMLVIGCYVMIGICMLAVALGGNEKGSHSRKYRY